MPKGCWNCCARAAADAPWCCWLWLTIVVYSIGLIGSRIGFQITAPIIRNQIIRNFDRDITEANARRAATRPSTAPAGTSDELGIVVVNLNETAARPRAAATGPTTAPANMSRPQRVIRNFFVAFTPARFWVFVCFFSVFFGHLIPCLFIPWTFRESLRPAAALLIVNSLIIGNDIAQGHIAFWPWALGAVFPIAGIVPGSAWCWWRERRFRKHFRTTFESKSFRKLQHELSDARRVHEALLPAPRTHGPVRLHYVYEPMRQIGGDLLFVFPPSHQHEQDGVSALNLVVLDVTGHGIAAALTVNRIVGELERTFIENPDAPPGKVLSVLNRYVYSTLSKHDLYVTAICLRVDSERDTLEYASGGHPTAFLRRADGSIQVLESTAALLGILDESNYHPEPASMPFAPGDAVVAYTDGAAEARNHSDVQLGIRGVKDLLAKVAGDGRTPPDWPGEVMQRILAYRGAPPDDDTLIATLFRPKSSQ